MGSIGYTLPETRISSKFIPTGSDVIFSNLYTSILCFLYAICVCTIIVRYFPKCSKKICRCSNESEDFSNECNKISKETDVKIFIDKMIKDSR